MDDPQRAAFEQQVQVLVGHRIIGVRYCELDDDTGAPSWNVRHPAFDVLDYGLELVIETGEVLTVTWHDTFLSWNIWLYSGAMSELVSACISWNVTRGSRWSTLIDVPITAATIFWHWSEELDGTRMSFPQDIELLFASGQQVWLSASKYMQERDILFPMCDEIAVIFDPETARRYGIGAFAERRGWKTTWQGSRADVEALITAGKWPPIENDPPSGADV